MRCVGDTVLQLAFVAHHSTSLRPFSFLAPLCAHPCHKGGERRLVPFRSSFCRHGWASGLGCPVPTVNWLQPSATHAARYTCTCLVVIDLSTNLPIRRRPGTHGLVYYCPGLPFLALALFSCFFKATTTRLFSHLTFHRESHLLSQKIIRSSSAILPTALLPDKPRLRSKAVEYKAAHCFRHL